MNPAIVPIATDSPGLEHALPVLATGVVARPRVLVVDDQPANVQALYQAFTEDHQVFMATSGAQALKVCADKRPDLVLLDIEMPGMDGYEVCRRLKGDPQLRDIPVIFVTGHHDEQAEALGLDVGAVDFIAKPINPRIVRARARTHITLKRQTDLLRAWVFIDGLTGVFNRRAFEERLLTEWRRCGRDGQPLAVAMIDVDHFKRYNDQLGHQAGDDCLRRVARTLQAGLKRPGDVLARYGGEEFACILPGTDLEGAMATVGKLVGDVHGAGIAHPSSDVAPVVTVSAGVTATRPLAEGPGPHELVSIADTALYRAKQRGRGCVVAGALSA